MSDIWYRSLRGMTEGPITLRDLQHMADIGTLKPSDLISQDGASWKPAGETPEVHFFAESLHSLNYPIPNPQPTQITQHVIDLLRQTSLWVRIMWIILIVSSAFMLLGAGIMLLLAIFQPAGGDPPQALLIGILYVFISITYIMPIIYLHRYASHAKAFVRLRTEQDLEQAMLAQKSFWKYVAVLALVIIGLDILAIPVAIIAAVILHK